MISYKTVKQEASDEFIMNKSRFIGYACPCETEEEALAFLKKIRDRHRDATHNCYAYVIGKNAGIMRYSDDGEPGGTAGLPIMEVIKNREIVNCCVVVTRYFGGILLGAGGLVRAYTKGCIVALDAARISVMEKSCRLIFDIPYSLWDKMRHALQNLPVITECTNFSTSVEAEILIREKDTEQVCSFLTALSGGKASYLTADELFYPWPEKTQPQ